MIRNYKFEDRTTLCDFFAIVLEEHKDYISHGELQMGIATDPGILAADYKQKWLQYLDRQTADPSNTVLLYEDNGILTGFIIFGVMEDGAEPYGVIFDMAVAPDARGKRIGEQLLEKSCREFPGNAGSATVIWNRALITIRLIIFFKNTVLHKSPISFE